MESWTFILKLMISAEAESSMATSRNIVLEVDLVVVLVAV